MTEGDIEVSRRVVAWSLVGFFVLVVMTLVYLGLPWLIPEVRSLDVWQVENATGAINLTDADLDSVPELRAALNHANQTGGASITDDGTIDRVCRFLEPRTGTCGARVLYRGQAFVIGLTVQ